MNRIFKFTDGGQHYLLRLTGLLFAFIFFFNVPVGAESERVSMDSRAFQHGINFVQRADDQWLLVWSSSGNPPAGINRKGNWTHDVYYSLIDTQKLVIHPNRLISKLEAQEPSSSAITEDGNLMITMEDGWDTKQNVAQRYAVYDAAMKPIKAYPQLVQDGGHSGHVAAVNQRFVVFYSDEWVHGGGVDNLGSGDDVLAKVYSSRGELEKTVPVAVGDANRDWWPLVAGSNRTAMLVWQRFVDDKTWSILMMAILDPETGQLQQKPIKIASRLKYYTYSVAYLPQLKRFLVTGTYKNGEGFAHMYSQTGQPVASLEKLPPVMREAQIIQHHSGGKTTVAQAIEPAGIVVLSVTDNNLVLQEKIDGIQKWSTAGTDGIFIDDNRLFLVGLSQSGLQQQLFEINPAAKKN